MRSTATPPRTLALPALPPTVLGLVLAWSEALRLRLVARIALRWGGR
ncbi:MAG TPA: hypothetical protein VFB73_09000 [Chloroflexota bacterium]|nr:hypothetical protein [Chloroflexota bacterium]